MDGARHFDTTIWFGRMTARRRCCTSIFPSGYLTSTWRRRVCRIVPTRYPDVAISTDLTDISTRDLALIAAQAAGDAQVLADHGRPVLRLHLTDRAAGLRQVLSVLGAADGATA